jgi:tripeptidyl-peptidase-1
MRYYRLTVLSVLAAAFLSSPATPLPSPWGEMLVKHKWINLPGNWVTLGHPPDGATIDLNIALRPDRENALITALQEVSQPRHPKHVFFTTSLFEAYSCMSLLLSRYGAYLTKEQVAQLVAPHPDTLELVSSWLKHNGVPPSSISTTHGGGWLTVAGVPVSHANKLLGASYQLYYHPGTNETVLRTVGYALPAALHIHVQTIVPTTAFTSARLLQSEETPRSRSGGAANATLGETVNMLSHRQANEPAVLIDIQVNPSVLSWLYRTDLYHPAATNQNELGMMGYQNEEPSAADLSAFMTVFRTDAADAAPTIEVVDNRYRGLVGMQANLDIQYSMALVYPTPIIYYRGSSNGMKLQSGTPLPDPYRDQYLQWLSQLTALQNVPQTISLGFGASERNIPQEYALSLCPLFARLGVLGASILVASGDDGVGQRFGLANERFYTSFPASCMCGVYSLLASCTQIQLTHRTVVISQVRGSLVSAVRSSLAAHPTSRTGRRSRIASPGVASRHSLRASTTRSSTVTLPPSSINSAACMMAATSVFAPAA